MKKIISLIVFVMIYAVSYSQWTSEVGKDEFGAPTKKIVFINSPMKSNDFEDNKSIVAMAKSDELIISFGEKDDLKVQTIGNKRYTIGQSYNFNRDLAVIPIKIKIDDNNPLEFDMSVKNRLMILKKSENSNFEELINEMKKGETLRAIISYEYTILLPGQPPIRHSRNTTVVISLRNFSNSYEALKKSGLLL